MGSRYLLFLVEDLSTFNFNSGEEERTNVISYLSLANHLFSCFLNCYKECTCDSAFYSVVSPQFEYLGKWLSTKDCSAIETLQELIACRLNDLNDRLQTVSDSVQYHLLYDSIIQLKSKLTQNDVVDIIWIVPNLEMKLQNQMSMEADESTTPFLYRSLQAMIDVSPFVQITLLSAYSSNSLSIWGKLLNASIYIVSSLSIPSSSISTNIILSKASTNSLIIETGDILQKPPNPVKQSRLPSIHYSNQFEVTVNELEVICYRILALNIEGRCHFEWREVNQQFHSSLNKQDELLNSIQRATASFIKTTKSSSFSLSTEYSIQLLHQFQSDDILQLLPFLLQCSIEYSIIFSHPLKHAMHSLLQSNTPTYYSCSILQRSGSNHHFSSLNTSLSSYSSYLGFLTLSSTSSSLYIFSSEQSSSSPYQFLLQKALHSSSSSILLDSDLPNELFQLPVMNIDTEETQSIFLPLSSLPRISFNLTQFSHSTGIDSSIKYHSAFSHSWIEEEYLKVISTLTIRESDLWRKRLFGEETMKQPTKKKIPKRKQMQPLLTTPISNRFPQNAYDLTRCFVHSGEPAIDMSFFDYHPLSIPSSIPSSFPLSSSCYNETASSLQQISIDEISQSSIYACFYEDYYNESNTTEEMKLRGMAQRVDGYATFLISSTQKNRMKLRKDGNNSDINKDRLERALQSTIQRLLPASYHDTPIYEKVWNLSLNLCSTVIETLYDTQRVVLPSSFFLKEAKKHVYHVVTSLLPNESISYQPPSSSSSKRPRRLSRSSSLIDLSPSNRSELSLLSETSLLGTPSSISTAFGYDTKRQRVLPSLPQAPEFPASVPFE